MDKAFFLDRDGTLNIDYNYVHTPGEWTWCDGALKALKWIKNHGFKIIVVTNQSGIVKGKYSEDDVQHLHRWVDEQLEAQNLSIDAWYYAPYHPEFKSSFAQEDRKPRLGMFSKAAQKHNIDFSKSYMAGDKVSDLKPAVELAIKPMFIRSRHEPNQDKAWLDEHKIEAFNTLWEGVQAIDKM